MGVTSRDVAELAGVSQPTVSRALRPDGQVSKTTRRRVLDAVAQLGYVPSERGRSLATRTTRQIAMVADLDNALYPHLVAPLHDALAAGGYRMVLLAERGEEIVSDERLLDGSVDGAVLTTSQVDSGLPAALAIRSVPFVELNRVAGSVSRRNRTSRSATGGVILSDSVTADNGAGGRAVARLLLDAGHRRIGGLLGGGETSSARDREKGLRQELARVRVPLPEKRVVRCQFSEAGGRAAVAELLSRPGPPPTALACVTDMVAVGAINELAARGLSVPGDMAVVGFDDLPIASWPVFDLTTVHVDFAEMARRAADLLLSRVVGQSTVPPRHERVRVHPVIRTSHLGPSTR